MNNSEQLKQDVGEEQKLTFEDLPRVTQIVLSKLCNIERFLNNIGIGIQSESVIWFTIEELCDYLPDKPAKTTVYGWTSRKLIPVHKKSKKLYFLKAEIDDWLKTSRRKTSLEINAEAEFYISKNR